MQLIKRHKKQENCTFSCDSVYLHLFSLLLIYVYIFILNVNRLVAEIFLKYE